MGQEALSEGRPHVHHGMRDHLGPLVGKPAPEGPQILLFGSFHDMKKFPALSDLPERRSFH